MTDPAPVLIDPLSARSLRLELAVNGQSLSNATGFVVEHHSTPYLITNWHVVAGRDPDTGQLLSPTGATPDEIKIIHHHRESLGVWMVTSQPLVSDEGAPLWLEHPAGSSIDVVALPLRNLQDEVVIHPLDLTLADANMVPEVAMPVSVIGYPMGMATGGAWPIWKTGHIASDPDIDYDGRPAFLIDATTRGGMSGSPVVLRLNGGFKTKEGNYLLAAGLTTLWLGVYSGRIHADIEIGLVWRPRVVHEILESVNAV